MMAGDIICRFKLFCIQKYATVIILPLIFIINLDYININIIYTIKSFYCIKNFDFVTKLNMSHLQDILQVISFCLSPGKKHYTSYIQYNQFLCLQVN